MSETLDFAAAAIKAAKEGNPTEMQNHIDSALMSKVGDALELKKIEISSNLIDGQDTNED